MSQTETEVIDSAEFRRRKYQLRGIRSVTQATQSHPKRYSTKTSQVRGYRANGLVTIVCDERDILE